MLWLPTVSELVAKVATPEPLRVPLPMVVAPSLKVTVPLGVPLPPVTVAVKVTDCPKTDGLAELVTTVVELALTSCVTRPVQAHC